MRRALRIILPLFAALLAPTDAWEASVSQNVTITITAATQMVGFSPTSLSFPSQNTGTSSNAQTITMTNTGTGSFPLSGVGIIGANAGDFSETNDCPSPLAVSARCHINVVFTPSAAGTRTASVAVSATGGGTYTVPLSGTGADLPNTQCDLTIAVGTSIQSAINSRPSGTKFCLPAGTWRGQVFTAKSNDQFLGAGAGLTILDGTGTNGRMTNGFDNGVTDVVIDSVTVTGYQADHTGTACASGGGWPQLQTGNGWIIRNSVFQNSGCTGVFIAGSASLINNRFTNNQKLGVFCYVNIPGAGTAILVQGNEFDNNNQGHYAQNNTPAGIKCYAEPNWSSIQTVRILNNYVHDNVATGIWLDTNIRNATVQGNTVINNAVTGIHYEVSGGPCDISHNVINGNGKGPFYTSNKGMGIYISTSSNCNVHDNNIFSPAGSWGPIYMQTDTRGDAPPDRGQNIHIYNNTITFGGGSGVLLNGFTNNSGITPTGSYSDNNSFFDTAGTSNARWLWNTTPYAAMTWSTYKSTTGQDAHSTLTSGNASVAGCTQIGCTSSGW